MDELTMDPLTDLVLQQAEGFSTPQAPPSTITAHPSTVSLRAKFEVPAEGPPDFPPPAPDRATYLTVSDIAALIRKWPDHEYTRLWQVFNVKAEWVHTTKYPPGFVDRMFGIVSQRLRRNDKFISKYVGWCLKTGRIWSKEALAKYVVRLACMDVLLSEIAIGDAPPSEFPVNFGGDTHGH